MLTELLIGNLDIDERMAAMCFWRILLSSMALICLMHSPAQSESLPPSFVAFWQQFRTAVIENDVKAVIKMTQFPFVMADGSKLRTAKAFKNNYGEIFSRLTDVAQCFRDTNLDDIQMNAENEYFVNCPDSSGDYVIPYSFLLTKSGWRFIQFDDFSETSETPPSA